jgi:uncharacterized protein (TIGR02145 family)
MREIKIGEQIWTIDNLDVTTYRNGDLIPKVEDAEEWRNLKTGAWCYFENNPDNNSNHGKLYNYHAITDPRGLAPEGFRIPQHYDWLLIQKFGIRLKPRGDWQEKHEWEFYIPFNANPEGYRDCNGSFRYKNEAVGWWASPERDVKNQGNIAHWLFQTEPQLGWKPFFENDGFYVRCIKENYKTMDFYFSDNIQFFCKSISVKYTAQTTFQEVLNLIYKNCLKDKVSSYSYGVDWIIQIYDGERMTNLNKIDYSGDMIFDHILDSQYRTAFRLIINRL